MHPIGPEAGSSRSVADEGTADSVHKTVKIYSFARGHSRSLRKPAVPRNPAPCTLDRRANAFDGCAKDDIGGERRHDR